MKSDMSDVKDPPSVAMICWRPFAALKMRKARRIRKIRNTCPPRCSFRGLDFGSRISGSGLGDEGSGFRVSDQVLGPVAGLLYGFGSRVDPENGGVDWGFGFGLRVPGSGFRDPGPVSGFGFRVSGFGFRVSGFGFRVSGFGFRVSGFGFRVSGFGFRVSG